MVTNVPPALLPLHQSPDMMNMSVVLGKLVKRPGYTALRETGIGDPVVGLASVQDEDDGTHLFAISTTGLYKDSAGWTALTGPALTGSSDQLFTYEVSQNSLVFSQGVDQVMRMPFTGTTYAILDADCPPAKYMTRAADRLILAYTVESSVNKPFRVRRSVASDHTDWTGLGSGFTDLSEFPYHIKNIRKLGSRLAVYVEKAVHIGTRTGNASAPLSFEPIVTESGLYAPHTLKGRRQAHMYLGNDSVYEFDGGNVLDIAEGVRDEIFSTLNAAKINTAFGEILNETQEYLIFMTTGAQTTPDRIWVHNWARRIWYPWSISSAKCSTLHRVDSSSTWDSLNVTWDSLAIQWDAYSLQQAYPAMLTGHDDGQIYIWGRIYTGDNGSAIQCYWTSKDLNGADVDPLARGFMVTLTNVGIWFKDPGTDFTFNVYFSVDSGNTWEGPYTETVESLGNKEVFHRVDKQVTGHTVRIKIEQNSATETLAISSVHPRLELRDMPA